jgi:hydroxymethylbilane synthase
MTTSRDLRIGTRGSPLALWQAHHVADRLRAAHAGLRIELIEIQTIGDQVQTVPLASLGGEGVFTKAIQNALLDRRVDVAVHSLKDLPTIVTPDLTLAAVPTRGPTGDVLVSTRHASFAALPAGAVVATSSLRRRAQILHRRPDLKLVEIRGNVDTRLRKLIDQNLDAIVLAEAGLVRLGLDRHITEVLDASWMFPAVGQGALGIECRADDTDTKKILAAIDDPGTHGAVLAERAMLRSLGGGCHVPIGARSRIDAGVLTVVGAVLAPDGSRRIEATLGGKLDAAESIGNDLAKMLAERGAGDLLAADRG